MAQLVLIQPSMPAAASPRRRVARFFVHAAQRRRVQAQASSSQKDERRSVCVGLDASTSRMDRMGCCCRISRRISCAFCATWEPNRYWRRRGSGKTTTRSQSDDATSKRKGGAGGYDCIPKVAVWVPLDTVLDVFLVRASPADAKPIASRGLLSPDFRSGSAASTGQWARSAGNGLEMGWRWGGIYRGGAPVALMGRRGRLPMASENGPQSF